MSWELKTSWPSPEMKSKCWTPWRTESAKVRLTKALMLRWSTRDNQESYWDCSGSDGRVSAGKTNWRKVRNVDGQLSRRAFIDSQSEMMSVRTVRGRKQKTSERRQQMSGWQGLDQRQSGRRHKRRWRNDSTWDGERDTCEQGRAGDQSFKISPHIYCDWGKPSR